MELVVIGAGCAGCALASLFSASGSKVRALVTKSSESASAVSVLFPEAEVLASSELDKSGVFDKPAFLVFATKDDHLVSAIEGVCSRLESWNSWRVVHLSGGSELALLDGFAEKGAATGVLHPCYPIPTRDSVFPADNTVCMSYQGDAAIGELLQEILEANSILFARLPKLSKVAYHAAMVLSAGHVMTLLAQAEQVLLREGMSAEESRKVLASVAQGVVTNFRSAPEEIASADLLTGPFVRNDRKLIEAQVEALSQRVPGLEEIYLTLGKLTQTIKEASNRR